MHVVSLHPISPDAVETYVGALHGGPVPPAWETWFDETLRSDLESARRGDEPAMHRLTFGLVLALAEVAPSYHGPDCGLSFWEARVDRSIGMLMRPPSRLFADAGLAEPVARAMPIRLDSQAGPMGGAFIPARLIGQAVSMLDEHLERSARRLAEAEVHPMAAIGLMHAALTHAHEQGMGLYEAQGLLGAAVPGRTAFGPGDVQLGQELAARIALVLVPPKKPGLWQRLTGRGGHAEVNGQGQKSDAHHEEA